MHVEHLHLVVDLRGRPTHDNHDSGNVKTKTKKATNYKGKKVKSCWY